MLLRRCFDGSERLVGLLCSFHLTLAVKGQFINETDSLTASHKLMKSHLTKHAQDLCNLSIQYNDLKLLLYSNIGIVPGNAHINIARRSLSKHRYLFLKTKNQKVVNLIKRRRQPCNTNYSVPKINISNYYLSNQERQPLKSDSHLPKIRFILCFNDSPSEMMKNAFYFILKAFFVLKIFKFLS